MENPKPPGYWSNIKAANIGDKYGLLQAGGKYAVIREFKDYNGIVHPVGETWYFLAYAFLPYDNGLQWFVTVDGQEEYDIPLYLEVEEFSRVAEHISDYIKKIG